jgi:16S rRNA (cytosine1402-N4)-methyltransferase
MPSALAEAGFPQVDRILLDLGISSFQLDNAERGFSFDNDGQLDMRMDRSQGITAGDIVNHWDETEIANLIYQYGEERLSRRIARKIVESRKEQTIETTEQLRSIIEVAVAGTGYRSRNRIHPATRSFQALRLRVNTELESLKAILDEYLMVLKPGGRIGIISFHSLEDRLVKTAFKRDAGECVCSRPLELCTCSRQPHIRILTKKPVVPGEDEVRSNPRARSAKFRVAEKL